MELYEVFMVREDLDLLSALYITEPLLNALNNCNYSPVVYDVPLIGGLQHERLVSYCQELVGVSKDLEETNNA